MDLETARKVIADEGLERYAWFGDPKGHPDVSALAPDGPGLILLTTDERGEPGWEYRPATEELGAVLLLVRVRLARDLDAARERPRRDVEPFTKEELVKALVAEGLAPLVHFGPPWRSAADTAYLFRRGGFWVTVLTGERAVVEIKTVRKYRDEAEARGDLLAAARLLPLGN